MNVLSRIRHHAWIARNWLRGDYNGGRMVYGQFGEDLVAWNALTQGRKEFCPRAVRYLDIGANHPSRLSNTMFAYQRGGRGVLVEPNPSLAALLRKKRPGDVVLQAGISSTAADDLNFHVFDPHVLSTFSDESAIGYESAGYSKVGEIEVPVFGINDVLRDHFSDGCPDFISIDVEGLDAEIVRATDWQSFPAAVVCVETWDFAAKQEIHGIGEHLRCNGYQELARLGPNSIFITR